MSCLKLVITAMLLWEVMVTTLYLHWRFFIYLCTHNGHVIEYIYFEKSFPVVFVTVVFCFLNNGHSNRHQKNI